MIISLYFQFWLILTSTLQELFCTNLQIL
uniref:Uncharacterized protein n=1 Tax=Anguilla anguilla TaxID=7936 RepID=A0A0E9QRI2_ANGAN